MGEPNIYRQFGINPNVSEIARRYGFDCRTIASYWEEDGDINDGRCRRASGFDRHRAAPEEKAPLPGVTKKVVRECLLRRLGDAAPPGYNAFTHYCRRHDIPVQGSRGAPKPIRASRPRQAASCSSTGRSRCACPAVMAICSSPTRLRPRWGAPGYTASSARGPGLLTTYSPTSWRRYGRWAVCLRND